MMHFKKINEFCDVFIFLIIYIYIVKSAYSKSAEKSKIVYYKRGLL